MGQYQKLDGQKNEFVVEENGLKFIINLSDYLDTGLFLDHRTTRQMIREESKGKKVLNLFAYTGSFSVNAAAGGASEVFSVDLSNTYLDWARKNFQLNGFKESKKYQFIQADVLAYLKRKETSAFDLIILDPPTFSNSKRMDDFLDIQRDHPLLINQCLDMLKENGAVYFSTNSSKFIWKKKKSTARAIKDITRQTTPFDFQNRFSHWCYRIMK